MTEPGPVPFVSILVVSRNDERTIERCVESCLNQTYPQQARELIVYDDCSGDGQRCLLRGLLERHKDLAASGHFRVIFAETHGGVCVGRNAAARAARGNLLLYSDGDAYPDPGWAAALQPRFDEAGVGVIASRILFHRRPELINGLGATANFFGVGIDLFTLQPADAVPAHGRYCLYATGCGMAITRDCWKAAGGFDERIINYYDDLDFGIRAWKAGFRIATAPDAAIHHDITSLGRIHSPAMTYLIELGRWRVMLKHWPLRVLAQSIIYQLHLIRRGIYPRNKRPILLRALLGLAREWPAILSYRRSCDRNAPHTFWHLLDPRHSHYGSTIAFSPDLLDAHLPSDPFRVAHCADRRYVVPLGAVIGPHLSLMNAGHIRFTLFRQTTRLELVYTAARPPIQVRALVSTADGPRELNLWIDSEGGRLAVPIPAGSTSCTLRFLPVNPVPAHPIFPESIITCVEARQS